MLQVLHLNVSKVDRVLYFPPRLLLPRLGVSSASSATHEVRHSRLGPSPSRCSSWEYGSGGGAGASVGMWIGMACACEMATSARGCG
jgi:hypothetical protein